MTEDHLLEDVLRESRINCNPNGDLPIKFKRPNNNQQSSSKVDFNIWISFEKILEKFRFKLPTLQLETQIIFRSFRVEIFNESIMDCYIKLK
ncbi:putative ATP-dependent RNA helicase pitchoune [Sarcoptes scabiei]|nr:putative ATP-dependent RNA helicase pitchoune [Sarcoptes scabiei]